MRNLIFLILFCVLCLAYAPASAQLDPNYAFQHRVLPGMYYRYQYELRSLLRAPEVGRVLTAWQANVNEGFPDSAKVASVRRAEWKVDSFDVSGLIVYVITPPKPKKSPLCYLFGLVYPKEGATQDFHVLKRGFYTLERNDMDPSYTPLCGWIVTAENASHQNYGDYKGKKPEDFVRRIADHVRGVKKLEKKAGIDIPIPTDTTEKRQGVSDDNGGGAP